MGIDGVGGPKIGSAGIASEPKIEPAKVDAPPPPAPSAPGIGAKISEGFDAFKKKLMSTTGKYSAHVVSAPDRPDLSSDVSAMRSAINAGGANFATASFVKSSNASAERELPPVGKNQMVDLSDKDMRNQMMRAAPQVNEISNKAGNGHDICAGAAMANGLIMTSDTPEKGAANAKAVRALAGEMTGFKIKPEEETALKHMEGAKMSPTDAMHMQQLMYRMQERMPTMINREGDTRGRSPGQVGCALTMLKAKGAFPGPEDVTFHNNTTRGPNGEKGQDHWTVTVGRTHANSDTNSHKAAVMGGPPAELSKYNKDWQADVSLYNSDPPAKVVQDIRTGDKSYTEAEFDPAKFDNIMRLSEYENQTRRATSRPDKPID